MFEPLQHRAGLWHPLSWPLEVYSCSYRICSFNRLLTPGLKVNFRQLKPVFLQHVGVWTYQLVKFTLPHIKSPLLDVTWSFLAILVHFGSSDDSVFYSSHFLVLLEFERQASSSFIKSLIKMCIEARLRTGSLSHSSVLFGCVWEGSCVGFGSWLAV